MREEAFRVRGMECGIERGEISCYERRCFHLYIPKTEKNKNKAREGREGRP
jgi:hypothetical protein